MFLHQVYVVIKYVICAITPLRDSGTKIKCYFLVYYYILNYFKKIQRRIRALSLDIYVSHSHAFLLIVRFKSYYLNFYSRKIKNNII